MQVRINRRSAAALTLLSAVFVSQCAVASATADDHPAQVEFTSPKAQTVEYGQYWEFPVRMDSNFYTIHNAGSTIVDVTGAPSGYAPPLVIVGGDATGSADGLVFAPGDMRPLSTGTYSISISGTHTFTGDGSTYSGHSTEPAKLTVTKAPLGIELRMVGDPNNWGAAVVTARLTGRFADEYQTSFYEGAALSPAGDWHITVKDGVGDVAIERNIERTAGDDTLATSFYWMEVTEGTKYTVNAEFVPSGASAGNFTVTPASEFSFTAPTTQRPVPTSTATAKPDTHLTAASGFGLPLWAVVLSVVLILGLGALVTVLSIRLNRKPGLEPTEPATTGDVAL